ncbi:unnamed protein product, partial [Polarella glacialis]
VSSPSEPKVVCTMLLWVTRFALGQTSRRALPWCSLVHQGHGDPMRQTSTSCTTRPFGRLTRRALPCCPKRPRRRKRRRVMRMISRLALGNFLRSTRPIRPIEPSGDS